MASTTFNGGNLIAGRFSAEGASSLQARDPHTGNPLEPPFTIAAEAEINRAVSLAAAASDDLGNRSLEDRAAFLDAIATNLTGLASDLVATAGRETALPEGRLQGELVRTTSQLRMFAELVRKGEFQDVRIEPGDPDRKPQPRPDLRRMLFPLGPVAVFGASNFPFAFSVAGGDTASAFAAGCPVIVKAHPAHPGSSELAASAITSAVAERNMPAAAFSMLHGGTETGRHLVLAHDLEAVAFTGSFAAGRALFQLAANRPRPIPVFAEMGSVNPIFFLEHTIALNGPALAKGFAGSLTLGTGQFCTNPGLIVGIGQPFERLLDEVVKNLQAAPHGVMLTPGISERYQREVKAREASARFTVRWVGKSDGMKVRPALFTVSASSVREQDEAFEEIFGPSAVAVVCRDIAEMRRVAELIPGQLTAALHGTDEDFPAARTLLPILERKAGRVLWNGFPTGVEVCGAMHHGGPYPATTDSRSTSVGTAAIQRFLRPIAFQDIPRELLPPALRD